MTRRTLREACAVFTLAAIVAGCASPTADLPSRGIPGHDGALGIDVTVVRKLSFFLDDLRVEPPREIHVAHVLPGGPADKAGIERGDVLIAIGDSRIASAPDIIQAVRATRPNSRIEVALRRDGEEKTVMLVVGELKVGE